MAVRPDEPPLPQIGRPEDQPENAEKLAVEPTTAKAINVKRPFSTATNHAARPFRANFLDADRERAISCLAIAALYEAGGQIDDQRPVMQVILNRVRHPAWPGSVCGVVFQGQERRTGCQFSFTCDGSMRRQQSASRLGPARSLAGLMLSGTYDPRVGLATHYHTDWVVPYWSSSLDKITAVKTHIFFRWKGYWGTPNAFRPSGTGKEPSIAAMAPYSNAHRAKSDADNDTADPAVLDDSTVAETFAPTLPATGPSTSRPSVRADGPAVQTIAFAPSMTAGQWSLKALSACGTKPVCRAVGWVDQTRVPDRLDRASLEKSPPDAVFVQTLRDRVQQAYWNCSIWPQLGTARCLDSPQNAAQLATAL